MRKWRKTVFHDLLKAIPNAVSMKGPISNFLLSSNSEVRRQPRLAEQGHSVMAGIWPAFQNIDDDKLIEKISGIL